MHGGALARDISHGAPHADPCGGSAFETLSAQPWRKGVRLPLVTDTAQDSSEA